MRLETQIFCGVTDLGCDVVSMISFSHILSNISNTRKSISSGYPNPENWVEKTRRSRVFLTDFELFGYLMKHSFECLIWLLTPFIILGEIQSKSSQILCKLRSGIQTTVTVVISFVFSL